MALADAVQGAKRPSQLITWTDQDGNAVDLTGSTITARIRPMAGGAVVVSDGTFVLVTASAGVFRWDYSTTDVATAGQYKVTFTATFGVAPSPGRTITEKWAVREAV